MLAKRDCVGDARLRGKRLQLRRALGRTDKDRRLRIAQEVLHLGALIGGIQRHIDEAGA